ncbi:MAG: DUF2281 domain-containing protein [Balneolaceae bacterium]|nr:MAG: DUF2281 domain-containing protein [Balneolaceae bacterium]
MSNRDILIKEINELPDEKIQEVINFVQFLKSKHLDDELGITLVSEPSLARDWNKPEEDEAWRDL